MAKFLSAILVALTPAVRCFGFEPEQVERLARRCAIRCRLAVRRARRGLAETLAAACQNASAAFARLQERLAGKPLALALEGPADPQIQAQEEETARNLEDAQPIRLESETATVAVQQIAPSPVQPMAAGRILSPECVAGLKVAAYGGLAFLCCLLFAANVVLQQSVLALSQLVLALYFAGAAGSAWVEGENARRRNLYAR